MKFFKCRVTIASLGHFFFYIPTLLLILGFPTDVLSISPRTTSEIDPLLVAQIIPDSTLETESSQVVHTGTLTERIEGGAIRGTHLFHSFEELNIGDSRSVYFANPSGIFTILSRITGNNASDILGTLGVDGPAHLFLLNPNGIMFGPNARLDIQGSFLATTEEQFTFPDGEIFSAINPEKPPLLTMSAPLGIQVGTVFTGNIASTGNLVAGEDLTLLGDQVYLEGQLIAGNNLTLQAQDTITIRDTRTDAFIAQADNNLTIQGNQGIDIWTLQHLEQVSFSSGGDLSLISNASISGDAHFESGDNLQFLTLMGTPGNFVSLYDPIIFANGDVVFGDYEGVALKVEATGNIEAGNIRITGPDITLIADGSGSDEDLLASSSAVILRAGVRSISSPNLPLSAGGTTFTGVPGTRLLPSSIVVDAINTTPVIDGGDGGPIILTADGNITTNANLDSLSRIQNNNNGNAGNGGDIIITSILGNISINGGISSFSQALGDGSAGNGGNINISSESGDIVVKGVLNSFSDSQGTSGNTGNAGSISIFSESGDITLHRLNAFSEADSGRSSRGGDVSISSRSGNISIINNRNRRRVINTSSIARTIGSSGDGGNISISSISGNIFANRDIDTFSKSEDNDAANGGNISISSESGGIELHRLNSFSEASSGRSSRGGDVSIYSIFDNISIIDNLTTINNESQRRVINTSSFARAVGSSSDGGNISISSTSGNIFTNGDIESFSQSKDNDAGNGGNIFISSESGNISIGSAAVDSTIPNNRIEAQGEIEAFSISGTGNAGNGGDITISSGTGEIVTEDFIRSFSFVESPIGGQAGNGGTISISSTSGDIKANGRLSSFSSTASERLEGGGTRNGGDVFISSVSGNISTNRIDSKSDFFSNADGPFSGPTAPTGNGGNISISSISGDITNNGFLVSGSISRNGDVGNGGDISIITREGIIRGNPNELITTVAVSEVGGDSGNGGRVFLQAPIIQNIRISTVSSQGESGNVVIQGIGDNLVIQDLGIVTSGQISVFNPAINTETSEPGQSIPLELSSFSLPGTTVITSSGDLTLNNVEILSDSNRSANAGNVEIFGAGDIQLNNSQILSNTNVGSSGQGGSVTITGEDSITLNNSLITTNTDGNGFAGSISLLTPLLNIQNGTQITAATNSSEISGIGGDITIEVDLMNLSGSTSGISVNTNGPATAGSITLEPFISDSIEIVTTGGDPQFSASTARGSSGQGGDIFIQNAELALLRNTKLLTGSSGSGNAGNIFVENVNVMLLRQGSLIQAGASADGDGGNINIDATIVLTVPEENNDILADTNSGTGGNINITAASILGYRSVEAFSRDLRNNQSNDISARSEQGNDGIVTLITPNIDPEQGLLELPSNLADQSDLITQRCLVDSESGQSSLIVTGRGGLPPSPSAITRSTNIGLVDLGTTHEEHSQFNHIITSVPGRSGVESQIEEQLQSIDQVIEAQGWFIAESGNIQLVNQILDDEVLPFSPEYSCLKS